MDHFRERHKLKKRIYSRTTRVILFIILALLVKPTWNIYAKHRESVENVERARQELNELRVKQAELTQKINDLQTGEGKDRAIREKFGVAKEGETFVVIVKGKEGEATSTVVEKKSFFGNVWSSVKGLFE